MRWIELISAHAMHDLALWERGGAEGLRSPELLESAMMRPQMRRHYRAGQASVPELAAAYAFGLIQDHPWVDGNKRTAFLVSGTFCEQNGYRFEAPETEVVAIFCAVAAGEISEVGLAGWFARHTRKVES